MRALGSPLSHLHARNALATRSVPPNVERVRHVLFIEMRYLHATSGGLVPSSIRIVGGCAAS